MCINGGGQYSGADFMIHLNHIYKYKWENSSVCEWFKLLRGVISDTHSPRPLHASIDRQQDRVLTRNRPTPG